MIKNNIKKDIDIIDSNSRYTLMITKIALCVFVILNLISRKISYDLILIFLITLLVENIQLYKISKQKEDLIAIIAIIVAIMGISILYIDSFLHFK